MALMLLPVYSSASSHQLCVAGFQLFPLSVYLMQSLFANLLPCLWPAIFAEGKLRKPNFKDLQQSYGVAALFAAGLHIYTLAVVIRRPDLSMTDFFWPTLAVEDFGEQVLLFLKFDYLFTFASLLLWVYLEIGLLGRYDMRVVGCSLFAGTLLLGPGATAAIAWSVREKRLLTELPHARGSAAKVK